MSSSEETRWVFPSVNKRVLEMGNNIITSSRGFLAAGLLKNLEFLKDTQGN